MKLEFNYENLSNLQLGELVRLVAAEQEYRLYHHSKVGPLPCLNAEERAFMLSTGHSAIATIKEYRLRVEVKLSDAKKVHDVYRDFMSLKDNT